MRVSPLFVAVSAVVFLSACGASEPQPAATATTPAAAPAPLPTEIPAAFQGRWGLTPDDCKAGAEGLLTVSADKLTFTESTATLVKVAEGTDNRFRGTFEFKGEGETRTTDEVLDLQDGMLVRREIGEGATLKPFAYSRCA